MAIRFWDRVHLALHMSGLDPSPRICGWLATFGGAKKCWMHTDTPTNEEPPVDGGSPGVAENDVSTVDQRLPVENSFPRV